jgi:hypothetical protein
VAGLADGDAHCGVICDAGTPTFLPAHWVRDRGLVVPGMKDALAGVRLPGGRGRDRRALPTPRPRRARGVTLVEARLPDVHRAFRHHGFAVFSGPRAGSAPHDFTPA